MEGIAVDAVMKRYGISNHVEFYETWSRAQYYVAVDAMFWAAAKEQKDYLPAPRDSDYSQVRAADIWTVMGF